MTREHFIPAGLIGSFSREPTGPLRRRRVSVLRTGSRASVPTRAEKVAFKNNFYVMDHTDEGLPRTSIDHMWTGYEASLHKALDHLVRRDVIDDATWLRVLVPFAVGTLCRAPAFEDESLAVSIRRGPNGETDYQRTPEDVNFARWMEVPRLLAPVMSCRWVVMHLPAGVPDITNDVGFAPMQAPDNVLPGIAIPIARQAVLALLPAKGRTILGRWNGGWLTPVEHVDLTHESARSFGVQLARQARQFIIGPDAESIDHLAGDLAKEEGRTSFFSVTGLSHLAMRDLIYEWHRVVTAASNQQLVDGPQQGFDWGVCQSGWCPPIILGLGEDTPTGVTYDRESDQILLEMPDTVLDGPEGRARP